MPRRLNWTNRARIAKSDAVVSVDSASSPPRFSVDLSLADYGLAGEARVVVEAYRSIQWRRYDFGTIALPRAVDDCTLDQFGDATGVLFRLKILSPKNDGRILAEADRLRRVDTADQLATRRSLLPTRAEPMGERVYRLDFDSSQSGPTLVMNSMLPDWRSAARSTAFRALVMPELLREVLERALPELDAETEGWAHDWATFALSIPGGHAALPESEDENEQWISDVVEAFCRRNQLCSIWSERLTDGGTD